MKPEETSLKQEDLADQDKISLILLQSLRVHLEVILRVFYHKLNQDCFIRTVKQSEDTLYISLYKLMKKKLIFSLKLTTQTV